MRFREEFNFLSNFFPCEIVFRGIRYPSVEHAYQALKFLREGDRWYIAKNLTAAEAKAKAKTALPEEKQPLFEANMDLVMLTLLRLKFKAGSPLGEKLLATASLELIEENWWHDCYWGVCTCGRAACAEGWNHLGKLLMDVRNELMNGRL